MNDRNAIKMNIGIRDREASQKNNTDTILTATRGHFVIAVAALVLASACLFPPPYPPDTQYTPPADGPGKIEVSVDNVKLANGISSVDFGSVMAGLTSDDKELKIKNIGAEYLAIQMPFSDGIDPGSFTISGYGDDHIYPQNYSSFVLRFEPGTEGSKTAHIIISSSDMDCPSFEFTVTGTGTQSLPKLSCTSSSWPYTSFANGGVLNLGACGLGQSATTGTIRLKNDGSATLVFTKPQVAVISGTDSSLFSIQGSLSTSLAKGASQDFYIRYTPVSFGKHTATMEIESNDTATGIFTMTLSAACNDIEEIGSFASYGDDYACMETSGSNVYVTYFDYDVTDLMFAASRDSGETWLAGDKLALDSVGNVGQFPAMFVNGSTIGISYWDASDTKLKFARSPDGGASWSIMIPDEQGNVGMQSAIAEDSGIILVSYLERVSDNKFNLKVARSSDSGTTWPQSEIHTIAEDVRNSRIRIALDGSYAYIFYTKWREGSCDLRCIVSADAGMSWNSSNERLVDVLPASRIFAEVSSGSITVLYGNDMGTSKIAQSFDQGYTWNTTPLVLPQSVSYTQWAIGKNGSELVFVNPSGPSFSHSPDMGATWDGVTQIDSVGSSSSLVLVSRSGASVYVLERTYEKIIFAHSRDLGITWY
jgi:hypothetical protein